MNTPIPGTPVRGSQSGRPIMALLDLLGRRMCLRILWELRDNCLRFRALQTAADTNPAVLNSRLHELKAASLVELAADGYQLTPKGIELIKIVMPIHDWAESWSETLSDD